MPGICSENQLPRTGAKYVLKAALIEHAKQAAFRKEGAEAGGVASEVAAQFAKSSMKFAGARSLFNKLVKKSEKIGSVTERVDTVLAAAKGMDFHIYTAITGPQAKKYNGGRGELGLEAHQEVADALVGLFCAVAPRLSDSQFDAFMAFIQDPKSTRCEPYGFDCYDRAMNLPTKAKAHPGFFEELSPQQQEALERLPSGGGSMW